MPSSLSFSLARPHRWPHPLHITRLGGIRRQFLEAKRGGLSREAGVLKQAASLQALLPESLVVLVEEVKRLVIGAHPFCLEPVRADVCRDPSVREHTGADKNTTGAVRACSGWEEG